jgi:predicted Rossmann fold nucleotide-binding protein DprA/Smf involved in DNA uptake
VTHGWDVAEDLDAAFPGVLNVSSRAAFPQFPEPETVVSSAALKGKNTLKKSDRKADYRDAKENLSPKTEKKRLDKETPRCYIDISEKLSALSETQQQVALAVLAGAGSAEEIIGNTGLEAKAVLTALTMLEIRRVTARDAAGHIIIREE